MMCEACWRGEYNGAAVVNDKTTRVADLIRRLYEDEGECVGGMLHCQLDDWNLEDDMWEPFPRPVRPGHPLQAHEREPLPVEQEIVDLMKTMTVDERASALAISEGFVTPDTP